MDTETVLATILPKVGALLKAVVAPVEQMDAPTRYQLEERTQGVLPQIGPVL
jgi:hypothetical protein